jgi:hypothetical protein
MNPVIDKDNGKSLEENKSGTTTVVRRKMPISNAVITPDPGA